MARSLLDGTIVESDPPHRLVMTFRPRWTGDVMDAPVSRVTWEITPHEEQSKLSLVHEGLEVHGAMGQEIQDGWTHIISDMKTLLETEVALMAARA